MTADAKLFSRKAVPHVFADKKANGAHAQDLLFAGNRSNLIAPVAIATESTKANQTSISFLKKYVTTFDDKQPQQMAQK